MCICASSLFDPNYDYLNIMNYIKSISLMAAVSVAPFLSLSAQTTVVGSGVLDGGFESGGTGTPWTGTGTFQTSQVRTGSFALALGADTTTGDPLEMYQNTGYTVAAGDTFSVEFYAGPRFQWDSDDQVIVNLFTTDDNTIGGTATSIASFTADGFANTGPAGNRIYVSSPFGGIIDTSTLDGVTQSSIAGQELFLQFTSVAAAGEFARIDDVTLTVTSAVPEPGTFALFAGFAGLAMVMSRRNRA